MYKLGLLFTRGVSLDKWVKTGLFQREKLLYERYLETGVFEEILWFTYGKDDGVLRDQLVQDGKLDSRIKVVSVEKATEQDFRSLDIIKSNQMQGAHLGIQIQDKYDVPFLCRTGYTLSLFKEKERNAAKGINRIWQSTKLWRYRRYEAKVLHACKQCIVASDDDRQYLIRQYGISPEKVNLVHNYIDCCQFEPKDEKDKKVEELIYVGRLSEQKNLYQTFDAIGRLGLTLDVYGDGEQKEELEKYVREHGYHIYFHGKVSNDKIPALLNQYRYYLLCSYYEGMPKTLLEAMACGLVCIGTDVEGIGEVITDGQTGILAKGTTSQDITIAIQRGLRLSELEWKKMSQQARNCICENYSLDAIVKLEKSILEGMV